jgi:pathogenesis-related protein 1
MEHKPIAIMILPVFVIGILMLGTMAATVNAQESSNPETTVGEASGADQQTILNMHNSERAAVGTPNLEWQGENLAWASRAATPNPPVAPSVEQLVGQWVNEPKDPHASNHYTQMVWKDTKEVGCATANVKGMTSDNWHGVGVYLVCRYSPPGNTQGAPAY